MFDALAGILGIALTTMPTSANAIQDGPVLAPPTDTRPSASTSLPLSPEEPRSIASPERRSQLRRLFRPRPSGMPPESVASPVVAPEARAPGPASSVRLGSPLSSTSSATFGSDPLGLEPLPADLELLPAAPVASSTRRPSASTPAATATTGLPEPIGLEVLPEYDDAPPLLGGTSSPLGEKSTIGGLPDPFPDTEPPSSAVDRKRPSESDSRRAARYDDDLDNDDDRLFERDLQKSLTNRLGRQVRDVNVRVRGETVTVRVNVNFFWNRRTVRHAIESMPDLAGYELNIDTY